MALSFQLSLSVFTALSQKLYAIFHTLLPAEFSHGAVIDASASSLLALLIKNLDQSPLFNEEVLYQLFYATLSDVLVPIFVGFFLIWLISKFPKLIVSVLALLILVLLGLVQSGIFKLSIPPDILYEYFKSWFLSVKLMQFLSAMIGGYLALKMNSPKPPRERTIG